MFCHCNFVICNQLLIDLCAEILLTFATFGNMLVWIVCGSRILREPLGTPSPKPFPGTFLAKNLENFSEKKFGLSIKSWKLVPPMPLPPLLPPLDMGILDFSKFGLSIKSWKLVPPTLPSHPRHGNFGFKQI